jgi:hypothetical protein
MLRIATGREAADTAIRSVHHGQADPLTMSVVAVVTRCPPTTPARRCCSAESAGQALVRSIETARTVARPRQSSAAAGE